jgi:acyl carrier protein
MTRPELLKQLRELLNNAVVLMNESVDRPDDDDLIFNAVSTACDLVEDQMIMLDGNHPTIWTRLCTIMQDLFDLDPNDLDPLDTLEDLNVGIGALDHAELLTALETQFGIEIPDEKFEQLVYLHDIEQLVIELDIACKNG